LNYDFTSHIKSNIKLKCNIVVYPVVEETITVAGDTSVIEVANQWRSSTTTICIYHVGIPVLNVCLKLMLIKKEVNYNEVLHI